MRDMGWMWGGPLPGGQAAEPLPEPSSTGAKLLTKYCTQCHAAPSPEFHAASEWAGVTARMAENMKLSNSGNGGGVKTPSDAEMQTIIGYLEKHAR